MRTLRFIVDGQIIRMDPSCDFSGLVPGTRGYLQAEFTFSKEWAGCRKAAVFSRYETEYPASIISSRCEIPEDILKNKSFNVSVVGEKSGYRIITNKVEVSQE